jgi:hypothetical protein
MKLKDIVKKGIVYTGLAAMLWLPTFNSAEAKHRTIPEPTGDMVGSMTSEEIDEYNERYRWVHRIMNEHERDQRRELRDWSYNLTEDQESALYAFMYEARLFNHYFKKASLDYSYDYYTGQLRGFDEVKTYTYDDDDEFIFTEVKYLDCNNTDSPVSISTTFFVDIDRYKSNDLRILFRADSVYEGRDLVDRDFYFSSFLITQNNGKTIFTEDIVDLELTPHMEHDYVGKLSRSIGNLERETIEKLNQSLSQSYYIACPAIQMSDY